MIKLIIFDLNNTLAYRDVNYSSTTKMLEVTKVDIPKDKFIDIFEESLQTRKWRKEYLAYKLLCKNMGLKTTKENIELLMKIRKDAEKKTKLYDHSIKLLKQLREQGYKIAIISDTSVFAIKEIKKTKLLDYVDYPIFSFDVGVCKPNKKIYLEALKIIKCKPQEALMIGDNIIDDVLTPRKLGMNALHYKGNYEKLKKGLKKFKIIVK
ncbi:MAG TPA: HAD family hydrolase [Candidatus Diapherotrites archaeon]|nr:HAD family hydrolase [Candidatus Diapherotrites archaeon]